MEIVRDSDVLLDMLALCGCEIDTVVESLLEIAFVIDDVAE